ncbi:hypothetical protein ACSQ67_007579 [Phaseolus vulgaris]
MVTDASHVFMKARNINVRKRISTIVCTSTLIFVLINERGLSLHSSLLLLLSAVNFCCSLLLFLQIFWGHSYSLN